MTTDLFTRLSELLADRYRLERELGQGGMATVYLAQDVRHDRKVALKLLRPELSAILGAERFLAEIKTTANLQHPHILSLFDSGTADGLVYYVMPYVEGESLRDRLHRDKQLPVEEAVRIAREVADALEYAHQKGIIHRDIKPENILLHGGHAMVADFGIALAASRSEGGSRMTETGMSLGTPHYMAPEQAMGEREITARADIYALGCVLYEMLTAEPPFQGATAQAIIARVMTEEPRSLTLQRKTVPPHVEAAVLTALSKLPADRFSSAAEFAAALGNPGFQTAATLGRTAFTAQPNPARARLLLAAPWVLFLVTALVFAGTRLFTKAPAPPPVLRLGLELPDHAIWGDQTGTSMALSQDGLTLVYNGRDSSGTQLFVRPLDRLEPIAIAGTKGATQPSVSPDGRWIGFFRGSAYHRIQLTGGTPETICAAPSGFTSFAWLDARTIVVAGPGNISSCRVGGELTRLVDVPDSVGAVSWPHVLPGGRGILFTGRVGSDFRLWVYDGRKRTLRSLGLLGSNPRYVAAGYLVYATADGIIRAAPFDGERLEVTGEPVAVLQGARVGSGGAAKLAVAPNGTMVTAFGTSGVRILELVDRRGVGERQSLPPGAYSYPRFSPDGRYIAVAVGDLVADIWIFDRRQGTLTRLSFEESASRPTWSPDGRRIIYTRIKGADADLRIINADGSAPAESLLTVPGRQIYQSAYLPDGRSLVVRTTGDGGGRDIWRVALDSTRALQPVLTSPSDEVAVTLSPDGRWMAYVSNESGRPEVYVRSYPSMGARYQVSLEGGSEPIWSPRGNEIIYRSFGTVLAARVRTSPGFEILGRDTLFTGPDYRTSPLEQQYDVAPDGQRLLMIRALERETSLTVILNWFENLRAGRLGDQAGAVAQ